MKKTYKEFWIPSVKNLNNKGPTSELAQTANAGDELNS